MRFYGKVLSFPNAVAPAIDCVFEREQFPVSEVQNNLADPSKLTLIRKTNHGRTGSRRDSVIIPFAGVVRRSRISSSLSWNSIGRPVTSPLRRPHQPSFRFSVPRACHPFLLRAPGQPGLDCKPNGRCSGLVAFSRRSTTAMAMRLRRSS